MTNGKRDLKSQSKQMAKLSDVLPPEKAKEGKLTIKDLVDKDIIILKVAERSNMDGVVKGVVVTVKIGEVESVVYIDKAKVVRKLRQIKDLLPLAAMITKGKRFYEIN